MTTLKNTGWLSSIVASALLAATPLAYAEQATRKEKHEFFLTAQSISGDTNPASSFEVEIGDTNFFGIGIGHNFTSKVNANFELFIGDTELATKRLGFDTKDSADAWSLGVNVDYNILNTRLTPVITVGGGWLSFSGDFSSNSGADFSETDLYYTIGAGVRWDVTKNWFIKVLYKTTSAGLGGIDDRFQLNGISLNLGYAY
ncbi:MAG: outer membrane beta-barrel protein [Pseudomonadota bacterium]